MNTKFNFVFQHNLLIIFRQRKNIIIELKAVLDCLPQIPQRTDKTGLSRPASTNQNGNRVKLEIDIQTLLKFLIFIRRIMETSS